MNARQKRFCEEYLVDCNATQAAIRAGYSPKTAYSQGQRMLKNVETKTYIDGQLEQLHSAKTADAREVIEYLTSVMRGECVNTDGSPVCMRDRLKAAELLGKRHGIFTERVQLDGVVPVMIVGDDHLED